MAKLIYSDHAVKKISDHNLKKWQIEKAFIKPDFVRPSTAPGCQNYVRTSNHLEIGATIKKTDDGNWLVVSAWRRKLTK
jgi:hypothetical protein